MNKLLARIKQGLRNIGRGDIDRIASPMPASCADEATPAQRMRTELDGAEADAKPAALAQPQVQPPPATSTRLRKATLAKARRIGSAQNSPSIWGLATPAGDGLFSAPVETPALFSGAAISGRAAPEDERAPRPRSGGFLDAAPSFGRTTEPPQPDDTLFGPAPSLAPGDEPKDRLF